MLIKMDEKHIRELEELVKGDFKCPHTDCCSYLEFQQCYNHAHVLCENYEAYAQSKQDKSLKKE